MRSRAALATARRDIALVCRRLYERGLIAGRDGNVSVRVTDHCIVVTPAGLSKGHLQPGDLVELSPNGVRLRGAHQPSSELAMHLAIYAARADIRSVVHAHPPHATAFAVSGTPLLTEALAELVYTVGRVPLVPYASPGSRDLADRVVPFLHGSDVLLLANHGAVAVGPSLWVAHQRMESLEHGARILLGARILSGMRPLTTDEVRALEVAREEAGRRAAAAVPRGWRGGRRR